MIKRTCLFFIMLLAMPFFSYAAAITQGNPLSHWQITIIPYGWLLGMNGTMTAKRNTSYPDITPIDTLKNLNQVDFLGELHMEAGKNRWSFMVDPTYLKLTTTIRKGPIGASISPEIALVDFGAYYTLMQSIPPPATRNLQLQGFLGARYFYMRIKLAPLRLPSIKGQEQFITPMIGARLISQLSPRAQVILRADIGGASIANVKNTWGASLIGDYTLNKFMAIALGFKILGINYSNGSGANHVDINTRFWGPELGLMFRL